MSENLVCLFGVLELVEVVVITFRSVTHATSDGGVNTSAAGAWQLCIL